MPDSRTTAPSLDVLLAAVQRGGDVDAWRALVSRLTPRLFRVARGLTAWRELGAQTVVEHSWRAAVRTLDAMDDGPALRRLLLTEVVGRALALGDSPREFPDDDNSARLAAMRAVALLPRPARSVLVLADIGGVELDDLSELLSLPDARIKAELWHARLAVDTLRGAGAAASPTPPILAAVDAAPAARDPEDDDAGVALLWLEPVPDELVDRIANDLHDRRQRRRMGARSASMKLPVLGGMLAAVVLSASAAIWREAPRLARNLSLPDARPVPPKRGDVANNQRARVSRLVPDVAQRPVVRVADRDDSMLPRRTSPSRVERSS